MTDNMPLLAPDDASAEQTLRGLMRRRIWLKLVKLVLALFAVIAVLSIIAFISFNQDTSRFNLTYTAIESSDELPPVMIKPKFQGVDASGRPYTVSAESAMQQGPEMVDLQALDAEITLSDGKWVTVKARTGTYDMQEKTLWLQGDVQLYYDAGYTFFTESALVDMTRNMVHGQHPVEGQGLLGTLRAGGFAATSEHQRLHFNKRVTLTIYPEQM